MNQSIAVVGAGICGLFTGLSLARKGFNVTFELPLTDRSNRPEIRASDNLYDQLKPVAHKPCGLKVYSKRCVLRTAANMGN